MTEIMHAMVIIRDVLLTELGRLVGGVVEVAEVALAKAMDAFDV